MKKSFWLIVLGLIFSVSANGAEQTKTRYEKIAQEFTKNPNAKIKPMMMKMQGITMKKSLGYLGKGEMSLVTGAPESAYKGKEFYQTVVDYSNCTIRKGEYAHNDCEHSMGVTRAEVKHKGSFGKGAEKWIHYAVRPMQNYFDQYRKKHISQCYASMPGDDEGFPMFFLDFRADFLWINLQQPMIYNTNLKQYVSDDVWAKLKSFKGKINKNLGATEWTSILVHFVNKADKDGLIEVFIDGSEKPAYRFEGPLYSNVGKKKPKVNCYLKLGPVVEQNKIALRKEVKEELGEITENMVVWYDALAIGKTREKVMELVEKDK
tara:strand:+ start:291 stop:1250 length:960 start_codon:yes stop_codon:yes gene_type:complete